MFLHNSPPTPIIKMRETSENLLKHSQNPSLAIKNQNPRENFAHNCLLLCNFCVATSQSWGSNPDRSPVAQWLNMRISPASLPPGVHSKPVPVPASAESPVRRGRFSEITILARIPFHSKPLPGPALAASPVRRGRFSEITILAQIPLHSKPLPGLASAASPVRREGFQKSQYWRATR